MRAACPRLVIAGTGSGVGKTSLALGLARWLARQGLRVQTFKVGPDFLDPTYLAMASGRTCYNLDGWMTSREYVRGLFARATADADIALIEGVMGMFDGASPDTLEGSTAEIALWLDAPVLLVVNAHGAARSLAATVKGFARFEPGVRVAGVIANQGGSPRHRAWLAESLAGAATRAAGGHGAPRIAAHACPAGIWDWSPPSRRTSRPRVLDQLADACEQHLDVLGDRGAGRRRSVQGAEPAGRARLDRRCVTSASDSESPDTTFRTPYVADRVRSGHRPRRGLPLLLCRQPGIARRGPASSGCRSRRWPTRGCPRTWTACTSAAAIPRCMRPGWPTTRECWPTSARFAASGGAIYAECGGLMYLGRALTTLDGVRYPLAGVLPIETAMLEKLKVLGYAEVTWAGRFAVGRGGRGRRGHEFHYSEITAEDGRADGWQPAYTVCRRRRRAAPAKGFCQGQRPGRLRASALGIAARGDPSLPLLLRETTMSDASRHRPES